MQRTLRINLTLTQEEVKTLQETQELYKEHFDTYAAWFHQNKTSSKVRGHAQVYSPLRKQYPEFPTGLHQAARDHASESIKSWNSKNWKKKWTKKPVMKLGKAMRYDKRTITLRGSLLTFSTVAGRIKTLVSLPEWWTDRYEGWKFQAASIGVDKLGQPFATLTFKTEDLPDERTVGKTMGLDRGIKNLVYTSEGVKVGGRGVRAKRRQHLFTRKTLQQKGTQNARRRLRQQSGREKRFMQQVNHEVSKQLASDPTVALYVLEDLSVIKRRKSDRWKKRSNKRLSDWAHGQLLEYLAYKCEAEGIRLAFVDPAYTSLTCSQCKSRFVERVGGRFECRRCGYRAHADFNAAVNIRDKYLSPHLYVGQAQVKGPDLVGQGGLVELPF